MATWTSHEHGVTFGLDSELDGGWLICPCGSSHYAADPGWTKADEAWVQEHKAHALAAEPTKEAEPRG